MRIRPKSIRGKLLFAFFVAIAPVLGVQIAEHVCDLAHLREELQTRHRMAAFAVAASIGTDMAWLRVQQRRAATQIALSGQPGATARRACEALDLMNIGLTRTQYDRTGSGPLDMAFGTARSPVFSGIVCNGGSKHAILVRSAIRGRDGGFGVLVTRIDERSLSNRLRELNRPSGLTLCAVVSRTGSVFGSPSGRAGLRFERSYFRGVVERSRSSRIMLVHSRFCKSTCLGTIVKVPGFDYWVVMAGPRQNTFLPALKQQATWIGASAASILLAAAILFAVGNRLSRPMRRLARAAQALAVGDFRKRVSVPAGDELGVLAQCFNSLGDSLAEREAQLRGQSEVLEGMAEAARMASSSLDTKECASDIAKVLCSHLGAEAAAVFLKDPAEGGVRAAAYSHERPSAAWARLAAHTASSGDYLVMTEQRTDCEASLVGIPLASTDSTVGAIVARFGGATREDLQLGGVRADVLTAFGVHAAAAISNAQAYSRSESYSEILEDWVEHLSSVKGVTDAISPALNLQEALEVLAQQTLEVMGADGCSIVLPDRAGKLVVRAIASKPGVKNVPVGLVLDIDRTEVGLAFAERRFVTCSDTLCSSRRQTVELHMACGLRAVLCAPLLFQDQSIGAITVSLQEARDFTPGEIRLLTSIGVHAAVMVRNAKLYTKESMIAEALQQGLVSVAPTHFGPLAFAGRYVPAFDEARVGGDFYDVLELDNGCVFVVMADVSGKGLSAAIHLAEAKYMLRAIVAQYPEDPGRVLRELNNVMNRAPDLGFFVTAFCAVIDVDNHMLYYANAGHPPALMISRRGQMHTCLNSTGIPVGTGYPHEFPSRSLAFEPTDTLLLYTDGVTESRTSGNEIGLEGLHRLVFEAGICEAKELVDRLYHALIDSGCSNQKDDVALLAVAFQPCARHADRTNGGRNVQAQGIAARQA